MRSSLLVLFSLAVCSRTTAQTLADAARNNTHTSAPKKVWTNDDISSTNSTVKDSDTPAAAKQAEASRLKIFEELRYIEKEKLGAAVLRRANAPDINFPDRKTWEQNLGDAMHDWAAQESRVDGHRDANPASFLEEQQLASKAFHKFERVEADGIEQARAETDPKIATRLKYKRMLASCQSMTGEYRNDCEAKAEKWRQEAE